MKKLISFLLFAGIYVQACSQDEEIRNGDKGSYHTREVVNVLKENENIKEGPYTMWYEGVKIISGNYSDNKKNGSWKYSNIDGVVFFQGNYTDDKKNGSWTYYRNQKPLAYTYYRNDEPDSTWQSFFENGKTQSKVSYIMGRRNGLYQLYHDNGNLAEESTYTDDGISDTLKRFYRDGSIQFIIYYKGNAIYNVLAMNDSLGNKQDFGTFANGTGLLKRYYSNGSIFSEVEYTNSQLNGTARLYNKNGKPGSVLNFVNGKASGRQTEYDTEGIADAEGEAANGFKTGKWTSYYKGGRSFEKEYAETDSIKVFVPVYYPPLPIQEMMPYAQGGEAGMMQFIIYNVEYPQKAKNKGISGAVYVTFVIDKKGKVKDARILRGVSQELDEEAMRVINSMPPWTPGFQGGFPVNVQFNLPIKYRLR